MVARGVGEKEICGEGQVSGVLEIPEQIGGANKEQVEAEPEIF